MSVKTSDNKWCVDRSALINYYPTVVFEMTRQDKILEDLIKGYEFIITADDVLKEVGSIPSHLCIGYVGETKRIPASECKLIYKEDKDGV